MDRIGELLRRRAGRIVRRLLAIVPRLAIGAPMSLVSAGVGIEYDDAMVAVAVGDVNLVGRRIDFSIGRSTQPSGIGAAGLRAGFADLQHKLSVLGEFQQMAIVVTVAADPDESLMVKVDAVLVLEPVITLSRPAPASQQIAVLIELHHRGRRRTTFGAWWIESRRLFIVS